MGMYDLGDSVYFMAAYNDTASLLDDKYIIVSVSDDEETFLIVNEKDIDKANSHEVLNDGITTDNKYQIILASRSNIMYDYEVDKLAKIIALITLYDYDNDLQGGNPEFIDLINRFNSDGEVDLIGSAMLIEGLKDFIDNKINDENMYKTYSDATLDGLLSTITHDFKDIHEFSEWINRVFGELNGVILKAHNTYYFNYDI